MIPPLPPHLSHCAFVLSVERGKLEAQAVLLVDSLRRFGGRYAQAPVYAVAPRPSRQPGDVCSRALTELGAHVVVDSLLSDEEQYGTIARLASCAWAEATLDCETLVSLDDDVFFAREPDFDLKDADMFARPVDVKGMCTTGPGDACDEYWRTIAEVCDVRYEDIPWLETTVDRVRVRASYNGGMVAVRRSKSIFQESFRLFQVLRSRNLSPRESGAVSVFASTGFVGPEASRWWGAAQAVLSLAATRLRAATSIAPPTYNVPAHLADRYQRHGRLFSLAGAVLVHYHWLLDQDHVSSSKPVDLPGAEDLPDAVVEWLSHKTPLKGEHA